MHISLLQGVLCACETAVSFSVGQRTYEGFRRKACVFFIISTDVSKKSDKFVTTLLSNCILI